MSDTAQVKVLVTGASGLLGRAVHQHFQSKGWNVVGLAFSRVKDGLIKCDLTDAKEVSEIIKREKPSFIIHAAAERFPDRVEQFYEETKILNVKVSEHLALEAKKCNAGLVYISTDYVFDGNSPPYKAEDVPNPINKYGQSKLDGERAVLSANPAACVLRIPVLYGPVEDLKESAVTCLLSLLLNLDPKKVSNYEKRYPSHVNDIAQILGDIIDCMIKEKSVSGIYQWSGKELLTKFEMIRIMSSVFNLPFDHIQPDSTQDPGSASRPYDAKLDTSKLQQLGIDHHTLFKEGIKKCLVKWI